MLKTGDDRHGKGIDTLMGGIESAVLASALLLAFVNGANDNFKGVATLYGSGALAYRPALALATLSTAAGSLLSGLAAVGLARAFSGRGIVPDALLDPRLLAAVAFAAAATVLLATRLGLPVSTTHALVGGIAGAGFVAAGPSLDLAALGRAFLLPLIAAPLLAAALAFAALRAGPGPDPRAGPPARLPSGRLVAWGHLASAGLVGFARGLNDTPKILGLLLGGALLSPVAGTLAITAAMALGGLIAARRVAETLAWRITPMTPPQGLAGNLATSLLVIGASRLGLPVSTTHVSTSAIFGIGAAEGSLRGGVLRGILSAWITTLPIAAALAAVLMGAARELS